MCMWSEAHTRRVWLFPDSPGTVWTSNELRSIRACKTRHRPINNTSIQSEDSFCLHHLVYIHEKLYTCQVEKFVDAFVAEWNVKPVLKCRRMGVTTTTLLSNNLLATDKQIEPTQSSELCNYLPCAQTHRLCTQFAAHLLQDGDRQVLDSIRTCLSKDFTHRQCTDCILDESTCDNGFYYYPA